MSGDVVRWVGGEIPAPVLRPDRSIAWMVGEQIHRTGGPALIDAKRSVHWIQRGKWHRLDGPAIVARDGSRQWWVDGKLHRVDGPAVEEPRGRLVWALGGRVMSEERHARALGSNTWKMGTSDSPSLFDLDGTRWWYHNAVLHRALGPAVQRRDGSVEWWSHGERHRADGPAVTLADGTYLWYVRGQLTRREMGGPESWMYPGEEVHQRPSYPGKRREVDGGVVEWRWEGVLHRDDGPAVLLPDGTECWYFKGTLHRHDGPAVTYSDGSTFWFRFGRLHRHEEPAIRYATNRRAWFLVWADHKRRGWQDYAGEQPCGCGHPSESRPDLTDIAATPLCRWETHQLHEARFAPDAVAAFLRVMDRPEVQEEWWTRGKPGLPKK